jgi:putative flippase GtrA
LARTQSLVRTIELQTPVQVRDEEQKWKRRRSLLWQLVRFSMVGGLNTAVDLLILNSILWLWPTRNTVMLLIYNSVAYTFGAINSFAWNKYWTFRRYQRVNSAEVVRFAFTTLSGIACNDVLLWLIGSLLHPMLLSATLWANVSKIIAVGNTALISYLAMRLWVFVQHAMEE